MIEKGKLSDREAKCPFFLSHTKDYIRCEGVVPDTVQKMEFVNRRGMRDEKAKTLHYKAFCCGRWRYCEQVEAVQRSKYDDEEE